MADTEARWTTHRREKRRRLDSLGLNDVRKVVEADRIDVVLASLIQSRDRVSLEGDNQKQADFLAQALSEADPARLHDLHLLISSVSLPAHLDVFERGIASRLDLAYAGPQSLRLAQLVEDQVVTIGAIHTYVELYARMFIDLSPNVALLCADAADAA